MSKTVIADRIDGRRQAETLLELASDELQTSSESRRIGFYRALITIAEAHLPSNAARSPRPTMSDDDAARFERQHVPFGKYAGRAWGNVPISYVLWLNETNEQIGAYLRSDRGQRRQVD